MLAINSKLIGINGSIVYHLLPTYYRIIVGCMSGGLEVIYVYKILCLNEV